MRITRKLLIILMIVSPSLYATDRVICLTGSDTNLGTVDSPFRSIPKALSVWKIGDRLVIPPGCEGTYDYPNLVQVPIVSTASGPVSIALPSGNVPLDSKFVMWAPPPQTVDLRVRLQGGLTKYNFSKRKVASGLLQCTIDPKTTVDPLVIK